DDLVTGVQTCALPICTDFDRAGVQRVMLGAARIPLVIFVHVRTLNFPVYPLTVPGADPDIDRITFRELACGWVVAAEPDRAYGEIGRASCRESGESMG